VTRLPRRTIWLVLALLLLAAANLAYLLRPKPEPRLTLTQAGWDQLVGWTEDRLAAAIPALLRSCTALLAKSEDAALDPLTKSTDFGRIGEWRQPCAAAQAVPTGNPAAARQFFESNFAPFLAGNNGDSQGLFTGYFEITLRGSRSRHGPFQTPLYRRPAEPSRYSRGEIDDGALAGQGLELLWVDDPIDAFFLEIQGSGRVRLDSGGMTRVGYDGSNAKPYVAIGRLLLERGETAREELTMAGIRDWMKAHPKEGAALRRENPSYVFFREIQGDGPLGAERVVLTPDRSLAVDRRFIPLGVPIWLDAQQRFQPGSIHRLVIAQDAGGAIKGPVRGDLFWGHGIGAAAGAGSMNARGRYFLLLPHAVAARLAPGS